MNIAVFASHGGSDLQAIVDGCKSGRINARVAVVISNNGSSMALQRAHSEKIPCYHLSAKKSGSEEILAGEILNVLSEYNIDMIFLAGYMRLLHASILQKYHGRIFNIHPALLPKFGGKGMYGINVHNAVIQAHESETGITIHRVNAEYDSGEIVAQTRMPVQADDTAETLAARVLEREHEFLIEVISDIANGKIALGDVIKATDSDDRENLAWEEIRTEHIVQDEWIDFRRSAYRFPDGSEFEPFYSYSRRDYVVIVASDEEGKYICVRQYRQGIKEVTTEFPAGGIERTDGREYGAVRDSTTAENALEAAKRELLEETGYVSDDWRHLLTVPSNATIADNYAHVYAAGNCRKSGEQNLDETEFLNVRTYSKAELEKMIDKGGFQQAVHIMAWLLAQRSR